MNHVSDACRHVDADAQFPLSQYFSSCGANTPSSGHFRSCSQGPIQLSDQYGSHLPLRALVKARRSLSRSECLN